MQSCAPSVAKEMGLEENLRRPMSHASTFGDEAPWLVIGPPHETKLGVPGLWVDGTGRNSRMGSVIGAESGRVADAVDFDFFRQGPLPGFAALDVGGA